MNKNVNTNALFKKAEESIAVAKRAMQGKKSLPWVACYHSQQAVEQFLRVFLASHGVSVSSRSLLGLNHECTGIDSDFKSFDATCDFLAFGGSDIRYPAHSKLSKTDAKKAIRAAEQIQQFVREKLT